MTLATPVKAQILAAALPWLKQLHDKIVVVLPLYPRLSHTQAHPRDGACRQLRVP